MRCTSPGVVALLAVCGLLLATPAASQTYKWTDKDGKVHYSDQPPPPEAKQSATVKTRKPAPATPPAADGAPPASASAPKTYEEQDADFKKRRVEAAEKQAADAKAAEEVAMKKRNCEQAQAQVATLQNGGRLTRSTASGEREYLGDEEIARELERAKQLANAWCK
jgi:hypothetical protein